MTRASRPSIIPAGCWPRRLSAAVAAYCDGTSIEDFLKRVGREYPLPCVAEGRRRLWLIDSLDAAIVPSAVQNDLAKDS